MPKFFLRHRTETNIQGPIDAGVVLEMAGTGKIHPEDMLQVAGKADAPWREAWRYRELFDPEISARYESGGAPKPGSGLAAGTSPLSEGNGKLFGILSLSFLGLLALSSFMPWAKAMGGEFSGIRGDGKIVLAVSLAVAALAVVGVFRPRWLAPLGAVCMAWGTMAALWMAMLLYKTASVTIPSDLKGSPFAVAASAQFGPGLGLYVGVIAGTCLAIFAGLLCVRASSPPYVSHGSARFRWLAIGQGVAIPLACLLFVWPLAVSGAGPSELTDAERREQRLLADTDKLIEDVKARTAENEARAKRIQESTAKATRANELVSSGTDLLDAWQEVGLLTIDMETRKAVVDSAWWASWAREEGARTKLLTLLGLHFKLNTGKSSLTVFEGDNGKSVGMVHADGEVAVFR
ncbi:MAG: hypothetical protein Q8L55_02495 [Phycisphaerales bacterium]|nr:hypothetical protein [Phycisphaerales bacterium]